jgi:acetyl-CoA carboxylase alpha subunit
MAKLSVEQKKERLKRELQKLRQKKEKNLKKKRIKRLKIINGEILRYTKRF